MAKARKKARKGTSRKHRSPAQKAATRKMLAANRAARGGTRKRKTGKRRAKRGTAKRTAKRTGGRSVAARLSHVEKHVAAQQHYNRLTETRFHAVGQAMHDVYRHAGLSTPSSMRQLSGGR